MRKLITASLLAISGALSAQANEQISVSDIALSPELQGNFYTACVQDRLQEQFPDTQVSVETRELRGKSMGFTIKAQFEEALRRPDGVSVYGALGDDGMVNRVTLSVKDGADDTTRTEYHPRHTGYEFFQVYNSHELSQFSASFAKAVEAISACPTTRFESEQNKNTQILALVQP